MKAGAFLFVLLSSAAAVADGKNPPDPPAATWNDPPPAGVETLKPSKPTWCAGYKPRPWLGGNLVYDDVKRGYTESLLTEIAQLACDRPDDRGRQAWIAFYRQGWLNIVGTTDAEDREAMAARLHVREQEKQVSEVCRKLRGDRDDDRSPADRTFDRMRAQAIGCDGDPREIDGTHSFDGSEDIAYWMDRDVEPPDELVRTTFVLRCLNVGSSTIDPKKVHMAIPYLAFCGHDAKLLDRKKFDQAVAALHLPPLGVARAREVFAYTKLLLAHDEAALADLAKKDADYAHLAYDIPAQGFDAWIKQRAANKAALDDALAMEDKFRDGDKHAVAGCGDSLRKQLADHVRSLHPKAKEDVRDAVNDDVGQPILKALIACDSLEQRYDVTATELQLLGSGRVRRGPRTAAYWAAVDALAKIVEDKTKFLAKPQSFGVRLPELTGKDNWMHVATESTYNQTSFDRDQKGQVAAVKRANDGVIVSFKTQSWQEPILNCHETNKIDRITSDGRVEYRQSCAYGGMETVHDTPPTVWIRKDLATGIAPGVAMQFRVDNKPKFGGKGGQAHGFPLEVTAGKKLVAYYGFAIGK